MTRLLLILALHALGLDGASVAAWWQPHTRTPAMTALAHGLRVDFAAREAGVPPALVAALMTVESELDAGAINRHSGAAGLLQVLCGPGGRWCSASIPRGKGERAALLDPLTNVREGCARLRAFSAGDGWRAALCRYQGERPCGSAGHADKVLRRLRRWQAVVGVVRDET